MAFTPEAALADCETYLEKLGFSLASDARKLITAMEQLGFQQDCELYPPVVLRTLLEHFGPLQTVMLRNGLEPHDALVAVEKSYGAGDFDPYGCEGYAPYSEERPRLDTRPRVVDFAMAAARRRGRAEITAEDIVAGFLDELDDPTPAIANVEWTDYRLHLPFNTLSHIIGHYEPSLWLKFSDVRDELGLTTPADARRGPIDAAPTYLKSPLMSLLADHPNYRTNCFLIMPFAQTAFHREVLSALRDTMGQLGFTLLRADDKHYADDMWTNIETYLHGCRFGIALHERVLSNTPNANVALEIGYLMGQLKPVCLLKERTLEHLPSDLQGRIYVEFDGMDSHSTLSRALQKWLSDKGLTPS